MFRLLYAYPEDLTVKETVESVTVGELLTIVFGVLFGMLILAGIAYMIASAHRNSRNSAQPYRTANAVVIDRQQLPANAVSFQTWVMFETEGGERVRLLCERSHNYIVGDRGRLSWQGDKLHNFSRGTSSHISNAHTGTKASVDAQLAQDNLPAWKRVQLEQEKARLEKEGGIEVKTVEVSAPVKSAKKCPECGTTQSGDNYVCVLCDADL